MIKSHYLLLLACLLSATVRAETLTIAVASNFAKPMSEIARAFEKESKHSVRVAFGSSGKLAAQLLQGAPFHMFFSADQDKPELLLKRGIATSGSSFTYALGGLALWSSDPTIDPERVLREGSFTKIALANPRLAPYGIAATEVLLNLTLLEASKPRWVLGENIAQTYQFVESGNAELGFVAASQIMENGKLIKGASWPVPQNLHNPIRQDAVLIGKQPSRAAREFAAFVSGAEVTNIIERYGYQTGEADSRAEP